MGDCLELTLPKPPSVNRFMGHLGNKSPAVRSWVKQADMSYVARAERPLPPSGASSGGIHLRARRGDRQQMQGCPRLVATIAIDRERPALPEADRLLGRARIRLHGEDTTVE